MLRVPFQFFLQNEDTGGYYKWTRAGGFVETPDETPLSYEPNKWKNTLIEWKRSKTYWGLFRNNTTPYEFVEDGAKIIKHLYAIYGVNAKCILKIKMLKSTDLLYYDFYTGKLDFNMFSSTRTSATVNIKEGGIVDFIFDNEETLQEVVLDSDDATKIYLDGMFLKSKWTLAQINQSVTINTNDTPARWHYMPLSPADEDDEFNAGDSFEVLTQTTVQAHNLPQNRYFFVANRTGTFTFNFNGQINYLLNAAASSAIKLKLVVNVYQDDSNGSPLLQSLDLYTDPNWLDPGDSRVLGINQTGVFTLNFGNIVTIHCEDVFDVGSPPFSNYVISYLGDGIMTITAVFRLPATKCLGYTYAEYWRRHIEGVSLGAYTGTSDYLNDATITQDDAFGLIPSKLFATAGDAIRGLSVFNRPTDPSISDPKLKSNIKDIFKTISSIAELGLVPDINAGEVQLKPLTEILDATTEIVDLGDVSFLKVEPAKDLIGNLLNIGYPNKDNDILNGKDEYNTTQQWKLPVNSQTTIDKVSPFRADPYGVESLRNKYYDKPTTDSQSDNDIFLLQVDPITQIDDAWELFRPQNNFSPVVVGGIIEENASAAFNLGLTPHRNILRNGHLLHAICDKLDGDVMRFQYVDKNPSLAAKIDINGIITEIAAININSLANKAFLPVYFTFTAKIPDNLIDLVNTNPFGYISFKYFGIVYKGFPMTIGTYPATKDVYNVTLLAHPDTDLTNI